MATCWATKQFVVLKEIPVNQLFQWGFARKSVRLSLLAIVGVGLWLCSASALTAATITYVQGNSATPQTPQTTVNVTYSAAQVVGDLNVVVVGWNDATATVKSVTDKSGNVYALAVGPTSYFTSLSQSIYYAKNIAP